jgi:drug/metabolite transporter (DMT)-like permease
VSQALVARRPLSGAEPSGARTLAALLVVYVVWGSTYLGILLAIRTIPVFLMGSIRFLIAGALLFAWSIRRGDAVADRPGRRQWLAAAVVGALLFLGGNTGVAWAEQHVTTGTSSLVIATIPLWIALFDRIACGQRLTRTTVLGLAIGFAGAAILAAPGPDSIDVAGGIVLLLAAMAWAAGSLYSRRAPLPRRPMVSASMQMLCGGALLLVVAAASGDLSRVHHVSTSSLLAVVYLVCIGSILAFTSYAWLLRNARTSLVATYAYVNPLVAVFLGWAFENESIGLRTGFAGALILAAVALIVSQPSLRRGGAPAAVPARAR